MWHFAKKVNPWAKNKVQDHRGIVFQPVSKISSFWWLALPSSFGPTFMNYFPLILRILLAGFFIWSGVVKLVDLKAFVETVANYQLLDRPLDAYVGYFVPWLEVFVGLAVLSGIFLRAGLFLYGGMLLCFSAAIIWVWSQGLNINCGCFGKSDEPTNYPLHLVLNGGLFLAVVWVFWTLSRGDVKTSK